MTEIHKTAIIDSRAEVAPDARIGPYVVIEGPSRIGAGVELGAHVVVGQFTDIHENCRIFPNAVVGMVPQDLKFAGEETTLEIGAGTTIREFVTVNRGTRASGATKIGRNCLLMAYAHVAHDCYVGDGVVMANAATLAGHIEIGDFATVGGLSAIHQFARIGRYAFIGGMSRISQDIIPYALVAGEPAKVVGVNLVGLTRRGFGDDVKQALRRAYHILYREDLNTAQALVKLAEELGGVAEVREIIDFVGRSERGILK